MKLMIVIVYSLFFNMNLFAAPSRIMIIRHAEKPLDPDNPHLSPKGYQRAQALSELFKIHPEYASKGLPDHIFASKYIPGDNAVRAIETITPLAKILGLTILTPYKGSKAKELGAEILKNQEYDDKVLLISWTHSNIPKLAEALGANCANEWEDSVFDRVWLLEFTKSGFECFDLPESVLPGDSK